MQRFFTWLNRFGFTGERKNWSPVDAAVYAGAYGKWGGSFILHPAVIPVVSEIAQVPLEYFACEEGGRPVAVVPVWGGQMIAGNRKYLDSIGKKTGWTQGIMNTGYPSHRRLSSPCLFRCVICLPHR